jgi:DNA-directed RNA polymerase specialized sigma24 family protein
MSDRSRSRREREFEEFAHARAAPLYRSAWFFCGSHHQAEDLVQETLAKVCAQWHRPLLFQDATAHVEPDVVTLVRGSIDRGRHRRRRRAAGGPTVTTTPVTYAGTPMQRCMRFEADSGRAWF